MSNDKYIWDFLLLEYKNMYGVAALMGNLYVESKLKSVYLQSSYARKLGMTSEEYTIAVDDGSYDNFVHDSAGYGLAQWTYWSRKQALYDYCKQHNKSIGNLDAQLDYLIKELSSYKTVVEAIKNASSVREASDIIAKKYERPADQSEKALANRASFGTKFYEKYATEDIKKVVILTDKVNIRCGNGKEYSRILLSYKDKEYPYIATAENGWYAVALSDRVGWVSSEFSKIK